MEAVLQLGNRKVMDSSGPRWGNLGSRDLAEKFGPANFNFGLHSAAKQFPPNFDLIRIPHFPIGFPPFVYPGPSINPVFPALPQTCTVSKAPEFQLQNQTRQLMDKKPGSLPAVSGAAKPTGIFRPWDDPPAVTKKSQKCRPESKTAVVNPFSPKSNPVGRPKTSGIQNSAVETVQDQQQSALEMIATNLGKSASGHRCIYCGKIYSRKYGLKIHLRTHTGFKPLKCKVCQRAFGDPSNLNKHTRLHAENGMAFKCNLCGKLLIRKRDLDRHLASRHSAGSGDDLGSPIFGSPTAVFQPEIDIDGQTVISDMSDSEDQVNVDV